MAKSASLTQGVDVVAPLDGIRVIEIDSWMAAPSAGAILADMGADVIKVEPLSGDPMRDLGRPAKLPDDIKGYDFQFTVDNRGKRSVAVALDTDEGADTVRRLVANAHIFMCNLLPQRQERFGLDPATLMKVNPSLVHATLTGYGTDGPDAWRPGYDVTAFFGRSGIYDAMREGQDGIVPMARPAQGDHTTGLAMSTAILAALRITESTGEGQAVETSLYETAVWTQATDYAVTAMDRAPLRQRAREEMIIPTANRYPCGDGKWLVMNMPEEAAWRRLCRIIGRDDWLEDNRLQDIRGRFKNMPELVAGIDAALSTKSRDEWGVIFDAEGLIWGPVLGLHEVANDPQAEAIGLFPTIDSPEIGEFRSVRIPMRFHNADVGPRGTAPALGEHTRSVLAEAGFTQEDIDSLSAAGAIPPPAETP
jgi:crotonobetainyl-CoA:carnitine CoA-transferase CaiB-like acyl-CoA transferase